MLKGISKHINSELLWVLSAMGHGDDIVVVDSNFPAASVAMKTVSGKLVHMSGLNSPQTVGAVLSLIPLDSFVDDPFRRMEVVGKPNEVLKIHQEALAEAEKAEGGKVKLGSVERFAFYEEAKKAFAVVRAAEDRPYGCFLIKKGVILASS